MNANPVDDIGLRARKKRARADAIVDAAQRLVLAHGFDAVTVEAIAEAAGISPRTFFNYFESKDDAVLGQGSFDLDAGFRGEFVAGGPTGRLTADLEVLAAALLGAVAGSDPHAPARVLELMQAEPRLLAHHFAWFERHKNQVEDLFTERHACRPLPTDPATCTMVVFVLVRAALDDWDAGGRQGDVTEHLPAALAKIAAVVNA
ncbi:TetR family transcriptional regulator [Isoptericola sp. CG 20/1183]|uniref:TetR family transcriptional regulator n=1 Tax=Isoptericola halotolerans TaxID=300560 RepID=A0ABX5ECY0_9MICO|nr:MULTISPECIES: TetR/AcrR family transcriptional regulator [Isoptericola]PRZ05689.1 TetR family transcriptional regulator [Isoptericola halotolerans]PRZ06257.1 TetR family transcriptional regulator [Isoptericola sp. CG 20/1183]